MSIVKRNRDGRITAVFVWRVEQIAEEPSDDYPDIAGILARVGRTLPIR